MAKEVKLQPQVEKKVQRVLGLDVDSKEFKGKKPEEVYEIMEARFDKVQKELHARTYGITLTQDQIALLLQEVLPNVEWVGQQAFDIVEAQKVIVELKPDVETKLLKEPIRAMFQFIVSNKYKGVDHVSAVADLLTNIATVIQTQIAQTDQIERDAGFELEAIRMGILPEVAVAEAIAADNAAKAV